MIEQWSIETNGSYTCGSHSIMYKLAEPLCEPMCTMFIMDTPEIM